jgi:hypothetical protein
MKEQTRMAVPERTYEMHGGEWREVEAQSNARPRSAPRGLGALVATICAVPAIVVFGIVATAVALVLLPAGLLAAWGLRAHTVWGLRALPVRRPEAEKFP